MNGLESIIDAIINEAQQQASQNIKAAEEEKAVIQAKADEEIEALEQESRKAAARESETAAERAESANEQYIKQQLIKTRMEFIYGVIEEAKNVIMSMSDADYFAAMEKLVKANAQSGDGVIVFGEKDLARMPKDFVKKCSDSVKGTLTLDKAPGAFDGGFIIKYGDIEENCTVDGLIRFRYDELCDTVNKFLPA